MNNVDIFNLSDMQIYMISVNQVLLKAVYNN